MKFNWQTIVIPAVIATGLSLFQPFFDEQKPNDVASSGEASAAYNGDLDFHFNYPEHPHSIVLPDGVEISAIANYTNLPPRDYIVRLHVSPGIVLERCVPISCSDTLRGVYFPSVNTDTLIHEQIDLEVNYYHYPDGSISNFESLSFSATQQGNQFPIGGGVQVIGAFMPTFFTHLPAIGHDPNKTFIPILQKMGSTN